MMGRATTSRHGRTPRRRRAQAHGAGVRALLHCPHCTLILLDAELRQVVVSQTPALSDQDGAACRRACRVQKEGVMYSVVKLRAVVPSERPGRAAKSPEVQHRGGRDAGRASSAPARRRGRRGQMFERRGRERVVRVRCSRKARTGSSMPTMLRTGFQIDDLFVLGLIFALKLCSLRRPLQPGARSRRCGWIRQLRGILQLGTKRALRPGIRGRGREIIVPLRNEALILAASRRRRRARCLSTSWSSSAYCPAAV